jgi:hypothetical protein
MMETTMRMQIMLLDDPNWQMTGFFLLTLALMFDGVSDEVGRPAPANPHQCRSTLLVLAAALPGLTQTIATDSECRRCRVSNGDP